MLSAIIYLKQIRSLGIIVNSCFMLCCRILIIIQNLLFEKKKIRNTIEILSNSLDPDQAGRFVRPDVGPNCLPRLSADDTGRQRVRI